MTLWAILRCGELPFAHQLFRLSNLCWRHCGCHTVSSFGGSGAHWQPVWPESASDQKWTWSTGGPISDKGPETDLILDRPAAQAGDGEACGRDGPSGILARPAARVVAKRAAKRHEPRLRGPLADIDTTWGRQRGVRLTD